MGEIQGALQGAKIRFGELEIPWKKLRPKILRMRFLKKGNYSREEE
jgi:hypothetical protein